MTGLEIERKKARKTTAQAILPRSYTPLDVLRTDTVSAEVLTVIRREFSCRYTPEHNGVAERKNRSVVEAARAMLEEKSLPKFYWADAVRSTSKHQRKTVDA